MKFHKSLLTLGAAVAVGSFATAAAPGTARANPAMTHAASPCAGAMKLGKCSGKMKKAKAKDKMSTAKCGGAMPKAKCGGK